MEVNYIKEESHEAEIEIDNATIVEVLRDYLAKDEHVEFVAWRREHPTKKPVLKIRTKGKTVKKALADAVSVIEKEADKLVAALKKAK